MARTTGLAKSRSRPCNRKNAIPNVALSPRSARLQNSDTMPGRAAMASQTREDCLWAPVNETNETTCQMPNNQYAAMMDVKKKPPLGTEFAPSANG